MWKLMICCSVPATWPFLCKFYEDKDNFIHRVVNLFLSVKCWTCSDLEVVQDSVIPKWTVCFLCRLLCMVVRRSGCLGLGLKVLFWGRVQMNSIELMTFQNSRHMVIRSLYILFFHSGIFTYPQAHPSIVIHTCVLITLFTFHLFMHSYICDEIHSTVSCALQNWPKYILC